MCVRLSASACLSRPPTHPRRRRRRSPPALAAAARCRRRPMPPPPPPLAARRSPLAGQFFCFAAAAAAAAAAQHMVELQLPRQSDGRWWRGAARGRPSRRRRGRVHTPAVAAHRARASSERGVAAAAAWQLSSLSASLSVAAARPRRQWGAGRSRAADAARACVARMAGTHTGRGSGRAGGGRAGGGRVIGSSGRCSPSEHGSPQRAAPRPALLLPAALVARLLGGDGAVLVDADGDVADGARERLGRVHRAHAGPQEIGIGPARLSRWSGWSVRPFEMIGQPPTPSPRRERRLGARAA